ncbi:hypothetical protein GCM10009863_28100 [Streptomyces axinellae]|uniref:Uncharacterized protein n=1 Tax=Streptomyces axinellae TaxID=552788 RepID=A0ABN3Q1Z9_9ACTN
MAAIAGLALLISASQSLLLNRPDRGSVPVFRKEKSGGQEATEHRYLTWDVRRRAESTFHPGGPDRFGFQGRKLGGELTFSVPHNCADRRIRWEIRADGERVGSGALRWLHTYKVTTDFALDRTPESVTLLMYWDGGGTDCPSFSAEWEDPLVNRDLTS